MTYPIPRDARIFVTGHRGLVGSAVVRHLHRVGFSKVLSATRDEVDLRDGRAVDAWFAEQRPEYVIHCAGTVGGIAANLARPADFLHDNVMLAATVLRAAWQCKVGKLLYLASSCVYPRDCPQPMRESSLLAGPLEPSNEPYAIAKLSGITACQAYRRQHGSSFISALPSNVYGPGDHFDPENSHVLAALVRKFHESKSSGERVVTVWGTGRPRRELLFVDDLADACLFLLERYDEPEPINVGTGADLAIAELADIVREIVFPAARIEFDTSRPDGVPRKLLDVGRLHALGWRHRTELRDGIEKMYRWYLEHLNHAASC
jgi:GDP-L-fucose synthase